MRKELPPDVRAKLVARLVQCCEKALREELQRERLGNGEPANDTAPAARVGSRLP